MSQGSHLSTLGRRCPHCPKRPRRSKQRRGKSLVLLVITLPTLCGMIGLVLDGGLMLATSRQAQHVADSAATVAAMEKKQGQPNSAALAAARQFVHDYNGLGSATVSMNCPPASGPYAGSSKHVELIIEDSYPTYFIHILGGPTARQISVRSVAGYEPTTTGAAIVVLDPDPPAFNVAPLPALPLVTSLPAILGGLEVEGLGSARVDGAVLVNTTWGGKDESGNQIGESTGLLGLSHAVSATPLVSLSRLQARDLRVVGGVDDPKNYGAYASGDRSPLHAGRLPVPDPFQDLPVPTVGADSQNVSTTVFGGKSVLGLPLIGPPVTLQPGIYDWIEVVSGIAVFQPGIYIIRGVNPATQMSLSILAGQVQANGVMFYITDTSSYSPVSGQPDATDGATVAPASSAMTLPPCVVINIGLLGSRFSGLNDPTSPFNGMLIYQRRLDRRPIILVQENLIGAGQMRGTIYSKWGHVVLAGKGTYDARFVVGTMRIIALLDLLIRPSTLLPPAEDVYLVE